MFKIAVPAALVVSVMLPVQAVYAQAPAAPPAEKTDQMFVIRPAQLLVLGAGALGGIIVGEMLFSTDLGMVVGGILGGYLTHLWYGGRQLEVHVGNTPKS
jgi:hypothetical protein